MAILDWILHPSELQAAAQYSIWHDPIHERDEKKESENLKKCYKFLEATSRSFSRVIMELRQELRVPVMLFYLVLRGLDTVEDDMTLPHDKKDKLLREFYQHLNEAGWKFQESGPNEADRQLLCEFDLVIDEFGKIPKKFQVIIADICKKMGQGMANYIGDTEQVSNGVITVQDFDLYCHYVAGLVGEGVTRLFVASEIENKRYLGQMGLANSMGLFLQKTNIIRDFREDLDDARLFWPKDVWSKYCKVHPKEFTLPENELQATYCVTELVANALAHVPDALSYLAGLRDQSVFNFCAIPQTMAIATLLLITNNPKIFHQNVKIRRGQAFKLMQKCVNVKEVAEVFREHADAIRHKISPQDPNLLKISIACGQIDQWYEQVFPDSKIALIEERIKELEKKKDDFKNSPASVLLEDGKTIEELMAELPEETEEERQQATREMWMLYAIVGITWTGLMVALIMLGYMGGARFDLAFKEVYLFVQELAGYVEPGTSEKFAESLGTGAGMPKLGFGGSMPRANVHQDL